MNAQTMKEMDAALKKIQRKKEKMRSKENALYNNLNKKYKQIDWSKEFLTKKDIEDALPNSSLGVLRKMRDEKVVRCFDREFYKTSNFENLFLLQEIMCHTDDLFWKKRKTVIVKQKLKPFYFDSAYRGRVFLFSYPESREWKAELLTEFLKTKEFLFDEDNPHWKGMKKVRYFCYKFLMNAKVEKWEYQVQRFLREKD